MVENPTWLFSYRFMCKKCGRRFKTWSAAAKHCVDEHELYECQSVKENITYAGGLVSGIGG